MKQLAAMFMVLALIPLPAKADRGDLPPRTSGFYVGAGAGGAQLDLKSGTVELSGSDFGYKLFGGYRFPRAFLPWGINIAIEAAYDNLGDIYDQPLGQDFNLAIEGFNLSAVGYIPMTTSWEFFGKAGAYNSDTKVTANGVLLSDQSSTDLSLGLGFAFQTGTAFGLQAEIESFNVADGAWLASLSATYQFK